MGNSFAYGNYMYPQLTTPDFSGMWLNPVINTSGKSSDEEDLKSPIFSVREAAKERIREKEAKKYAELQTKIDALELQQKENSRLLTLSKDAKVVETEADPKTGEKAAKVLMVSESKEEFKKLGFWKKLGRFSINAVSGAFNCGLKMLGIDEFSLLPPKLKVNWKQLGKTALSIAAIAAATCIPVVGPFVLPTLTALGVGLGGYKVVSGGIKAISTDDPEAFDNAAKSLGEGAVIAGLSVAGIRKMGGVKTMFTNAKTTALSDITAVQNAGKWGVAKTFGSKFATSFIDPVKAKIAPRKRLFDIHGWKSLLPKKPNWKWYQWITKPAIFAFWTLPCKPFGVYHKLAGTGYAAGYNLQRTIAPKYEQSIVGGLLASAGVAWMGGDKALTTKQKVKDENGNIVEQEIQLTQDDIDSIKSAKDEYAKQIQDLKSKQGAIYA